MNIKERIYEDYLKKSRLPDYRRTLETAKKNGYQMVSVLDFARIVRGEGVDGKLLYVNRHDIDTSPKVAAEMFSIEKDVYGMLGTASYYFRNTTTDARFISELDSYGYETGYHYEELASFAKKHRLRNRDALVSSIDEAGVLFLENLKKFRITTGSPSLTVASHGDFINTRFGIQSYEMLKLNNIREEANIEAEAYDYDIMHYVHERYADQILLSKYTSKVINAFERGCPIVMTLTHPRNWKVDLLANTEENFRRLGQDILFRL